MKWKWPLIFQTTSNPSSFKVFGFFNLTHIHLIQFHIHLLLSNANIVTELATWKIIIIIFTLVNIVENILIIDTYVLDTILMKEQSFTLDGSILGNGLQQPRRYIDHTTKFILMYWHVLQWRYFLLLTLYLKRGNWFSIIRFEVISSEPEPQIELDCRSRFRARVVTRDRLMFHEHDLVGGFLKPPPTKYFSFCYLFHQFVVIFKLSSITTCTSHNSPTSNQIQNYSMKLFRPCSKVGG